MSKDFLGAHPSNLRYLGDLMSSKFIVAEKKISKMAGDFLAKAGELLAAAGEEFSPGSPGPLYKPYFGVKLHHRV